MWSSLWIQLKAARHSISNSDAHEQENEDAREQRYQRALVNLGRFLAKGEPIAYSHFENDDRYDVCYLAGWYKEEYFTAGQYYVFKLLYTRQRSDFSQIGYRTFVEAQIQAYYDGQEPSPGATFECKQDAIDYTMRKRGYYEAE